MQLCQRFELVDLSIVIKMDCVLLSKQRSFSGFWLCSERKGESSGSSSNSWNLKLLQMLPHNNFPPSCKRRTFFIHSKSVFRFVCFVYSNQNEKWKSFRNFPFKLAICLWTPPPSRLRTARIQVIYFQGFPHFSETFSLSLNFSCDSLVASFRKLIFCGTFRRVLVELSVKFFATRCFSDKEGNKLFS